MDFSVARNGKTTFFPDGRIIQWFDTQFGSDSVEI
jgi:hypothetical protein